MVPSLRCKRSRTRGCSELKQMQPQTPRCQSAPHCAPLPRTAGAHTHSPSVPLSPCLCLPVSHSNDTSLVPRCLGQSVRHDADSLTDDSGGAGVLNAVNSQPKPRARCSHAHARTQPEQHDADLQFAGTGFHPRLLLPQPWLAVTRRRSSGVCVRTTGRPGCARAFGARVR